MTLTPIHDRWSSQLKSIFASAKKNITICTPYISTAGVDCVEASVSRRDVSIFVLTDLSARSIAEGSTSAAAVHALSQCTTKVLVSHLPRVHAKVYIVDSIQAVVGSANLTGGGLFANVEYGLRCSHARLARRIDSDIRAYASLGAVVTSDTLLKLADCEHDLRSKYEAQIKAVDSTVRRAYTKRLREAETQVLRSRLAVGALHTIFGRTVEYVLRRYGPMKTEDIHRWIESIHPDLCDPSVDRVINGVRFGKKWKHAVRSSQQKLKKDGIIHRVGRNWGIKPQR